jgi:mannose-6-phosphate isomerase-like protein (cupin superfamily)
MRKFDNTTAGTYAVGDVDVARWEQYGLGDLMPFQAMWYVVAPGASTPIDRHPELELSIVISGSAVVHAGDESIEVGGGDAFLLDGDEDHWVRNRGTEHPVVVFSAYWMPAADVSAAHEGQAARV